MPPKNAQDAPAEETEFPQALDEFCQNLSVKSMDPLAAPPPSVELIGGFHYSEGAANRRKDLPSKYRARFDAYCKRPVN